MNGPTLGEAIMGCRQVAAELAERLDEVPWPVRWYWRRRVVALWRSMDALESNVAYQRDRHLRELEIIP